MLEKGGCNKKKMPLRVKAGKEGKRGIITFAAFVVWVLRMLPLLSDRETGDPALLLSKPVKLMYVKK